MDICIKNVNSEEWSEFKSESAIHGMKAGEFLSKLVKEHKERCRESNWNRVLHGKKTLKHLISEKEMAKSRKLFREDFKLRF